MEHLENKLTIRIAGQEDFELVREFYYTIIDAMQNAQYKPGWKKDIYPTQDFLRESIAQKELYIGEWEGQIAACMVVNHIGNDSYGKVQWLVEAAESEQLVVHALGVHPTFSRRGIAGTMIQHLIQRAPQNGIKTIRLDVLKGNLPAERAYSKVGFQHLDTIQMYYEDTGWTDFKLYEYVIS